jgi:hypothetical protein
VIFFGMISGLGFWLVTPLNLMLISLPIVVDDILEKLDNLLVLPFIIEYHLQKLTKLYLAGLILIHGIYELFNLLPTFHQAHTDQQFLQLVNANRAILFYIHGVKTVFHLLPFRVIEVDQVLFALLGQPFSLLNQLQVGHMLLDRLLLWRGARGREQRLDVTMVHDHLLDTWMAYAFG